MLGTPVVLVLALWVIAIAVLVYFLRIEKLLWIPLLLAIAGVFSSMLPLAISPMLAGVANGTILILFVVSLQLLQSKQRLTAAVVKRRGR
jgi:hypothetical protein